MDTHFISFISGIIDFLLYASIIAVVLIVAGWAIIRLAKIKAPIYKHMVWLCILFAVVTLPAIWLYVPKVSVPVLPARSITQLEITQKDNISSTSGFAEDMHLENQSIGLPANVIPAENSSKLTVLISVKNILVFLWSTGFLFMLVRFLVGWQRIKQIVRSAEPLSLPGDLYTGNAFPSRLKMFLSTRIDVPICLGVFRPVILLPEEMYKNGESKDLMMILRHELAHIERRDCVVNMFQRFIEAILFFHPMIWYASAQLTQQREILCDHHVISKGVAPTDYVELLTRVIEQNFGRSTINAVALFEGRRLLSRIKALLSTGNKIQLKSSPAVIFVSVIIISLFMVSGTIRLEAKSQGDNQKAKTMGKTDHLTDRALISNGEATLKLKELFNYLDADITSLTPDILDKIRIQIKAGADVNIKNKLGNPPLLVASRKGYTEVVKLLLAGKADVNKVEKSTGKTPLHLASMQGHTEVVKLLLTAKVDVDSTDYGGFTPLHWASLGGHAEVVKLLLASKADVNKVSDITDTADATDINVRENTPLDMARSMFHDDVVELLLAAGGKSSGDNIAIGTLWYAANAQAEYRIDNKTYTDSIKTLEENYGLHIDEDLRLKIISADENQYHMIAFHKEGSKKFHVKWPDGGIEVYIEEPVKRTKDGNEKRRAGLNNPARTIQLQRDYVDTEIADLPNLLTQATIKPHFSNGEPDGLEIAMIKPGSIFRKMGLRRGDIVKSAAGKVVRSTDDLISFYNDLQAKDNVSIQIIRRGKEKSINLDLI